MNTRGLSLRSFSWRARALIVAGLLLAGGVAVFAYFSLASGSLIAAAESGDLAAVQAALAAGADVDHTRKRITGWQVGEPMRRVETALRKAAVGGHTEIVRTLLEAGADPDIICTGGSTALIGAAGSNRRGDRTEIIRLLLDAGADPIGPRSRGRTALEWAIVRGEYESVRLLLSASRTAGLPADVESRLLSYAQFRQDDLQHLVVKLLSIDDAESEIQRAARAGSASDLLKLLESGADPDTRDDDGWTPLHWAAGMEGDGPRTRVLLDAGANPNAVTDGGFTPVMAATQTGDLARVRMLLDAGADPNAVDKNGRSALHIAAWRAGEDMIRLLLQAGANPDIRNSSTQTPADVADARRRNLGEDVTSAFNATDDS
ncbi:MAG: ankyrin repeat domain-containing protein [Planctomycetota bacterium]|nr:ankyrin repeat domain-containing protein [Planctomycetota bacterium]